MNSTFFGIYKESFLVQSVAPLLCGFAFYVFLSFWKSQSARWGNWFPSLRAVMQYILYAVAASLSVATIMVVFAAKQIEFAGALVLCGLGLGAIFSFIGRQKEGEVHERGAVIAIAKAVAAMTKKRCAGNVLNIGGVPIPNDAEPFHLLIAGSTGSGKSVAIKGILDTIRERGETAIIVDSGGEFVDRYWDGMTDYLLNPFDARCTAWSPTAELAGLWDAEALARSIVPDGTGEAKEWNGYAQTFLGAVLKALYEQNNLSLSTLMRAVQVAPISELATLLAGSPAASQLDSEKMFGSIRTIAANYLTCFSYLPNESATFSVRKFVQEHKGGFLFLTYRDDQLDSLRNLMSFVLDVASRSILSLTPDPNRRIWLIIDEFASIGKVQSIESVATKARKNGGVLLIGLQSVSQLQDRYGEKQAQSILSCLSTWLVLRCSDADTAEYMSKYLGEQQIRQTIGNASSGDSGQSNSMNTTVQNRRVVLASEIQALPDCNGYLRVTGGYPICGVLLSFPKQVASATRAFIERNFAARPAVKPAEPVRQPEAAPASNPEGFDGPKIPTKPEARRLSDTERIGKLRTAYEQEIAKPGGGNQFVLEEIIDELETYCRAMG